MESRKRTVRKALSWSTIGLLAIVVVLHVVNHGKVRDALCKSGESECRTGIGLTSLEAQWRPTGLPETLRPKEVRVKATTALVRQGCDRQWTAGFGARIEIDPVAFGDLFVSNRACVDAFRQSVRGELTGARLHTASASPAWIRCASIGVMR